MNSMKLDGIALGGLSVGETKRGKDKVLKFLNHTFKLINLIM